MRPAPLTQVPDLPGKTLDQIESGELDGWSAEDLIRWGLECFSPRIALSASFGAPEGMVILDLMARIPESDTRVFTIDTGRLPQETYNLMDRVRERYGVSVEAYFPQPERVEGMLREHGANLFYESLAKRELCCAIRKLEPLKRALDGLDAWISGLRSGQGPTRSRVRSVEIDHAHGGRVKLNPLARWSSDEVWEYVRVHAVPVNALHAKGYPSVGCAPCSRAIQPGEDERAGRWWWESRDTRECGIHVDFEQKGSGI